MSARWQRIASVAIAMAAVSLGACGGDKAHAAGPGSPAPPPAQATSTVLVDTASVEIPMSLPAQLYVERDAIVAARAAGPIDTLRVDLGETVSAGELLATIESVDQRLALAQAVAARENAQRLVQRVHALSKLNGVTSADSEQAEFQLQQTSLATDRAHRALELTRVVAPFAGVVTGRWVRRFRLVAVGDTLLRITESGPLLARVHVPEGSAATLRAGLAASVSGAGGAASAATVRRIAPAIDAASGTREVVLEVAPHARLLPGSTVSVRLGAQRRSALIIPRGSVSADGYVLVVQTGRIVMRPVTLGPDMGGDRVAVVSGLSRGERVVLHPDANR